MTKESAKIFATRFLRARRRAAVRQQCRQQRPAGFTDVPELGTAKQSRPKLQSPIFKGLLQRSLGDAMRCAARYAPRVSQRHAG
jgi:hypothetical protein